MLEIKNLAVSIAGQKILHKIDLRIESGQTVVLFGPNGCGKTTLLMAIMGLGNFKIDSGQILFKGRDITHLPVNERVRLGIGMLFQRPPTVKGVTVRQLVEIAGKYQLDVDQLAVRINAKNFLDRSVNDGFSGGEIKRSELLQLAAQQPDLLLLDEPESGVDLDNIALIGNTVNKLLHEELFSGDDSDSLREHHRKRHRSGLVITHTGHILDYISADHGIVFMDGHVVCEANPIEILRTIRADGFEECKKCAQQERTARK